MNKLEQLIDKCKASVNLTINLHKDYYETVEERLKSFDPEDIADISEDVRKKMIDMDRIVELQFYPDTPIGSYVVYHWSVDAAIDEALTILK